MEKKTPRELFDENQRLVGYCARKWFSRLTASVDIDDLMQEGRLGLWRACIKFNPDLGHQFSTFAVPWINGSMSRLIRDQSTTIRISRTDYDAGNFEKYQVSSLDAEVFNKDDSPDLHQIIPAANDEYPNLTSDMVDDFLKTITDPRNRDIFEEWIYGKVYFESLTTTALAKKYGCSQAQVSRIIKKYCKEFQTWLHTIDKPLE
jgi:RNA polymerase sigma factor (sigma-70 family)